MSSRFGLIFAAAIGLVACAGTGKEPISDDSRATHRGSPAETGAIRLSPDAVLRMGIETGQLDSTNVPPTWSHSGQIVPLPGRAIVVSAPVAGAILGPAGWQLPIPGHRVGKGDTLIWLLPPDGDSATAEVGSVDSELEPESAAVAVVAPDAGVIRTINVLLWQSVSAGTGLVELVGVDRLWVRLVLEPKDARVIARAEPATVTVPGKPTRLRSFAAQPVTNLPFTDSASGSVDLFYEIRGAVRVLRPGERVIVALPLARPRRKALAAPLGAVVVDSRGGTWIYQRLDPVSFARRRVQVSRVVADQAILSDGPAPGTTVVIAGSAELFGAESAAVK
jgi:HlyD family secretion protein